MTGRLNAIRHTPAARALLIGFALLGLVGYLNAQSYTGRLDLWHFQTSSCERGLLGQADNIAGDLDDATFREDAARARAGGMEQLERLRLLLARFPRAIDGLVGDRHTAAVYLLKAERARERASARAQRLLGADLNVLGQRDEEGFPTPAADREATRACSTANPRPSPWRVLN